MGYWETDGDYPMLLQNSMDFVVLQLRNLFRVSIALKVVPSACKDERVAFISKLGKKSYTAAEDLRSVSLTCFTFKTIEKLFEIYIRHEVSLGFLLHRGLHTFKAD